MSKTAHSRRPLVTKFVKNYEENNDLGRDDYEQDKKKKKDTLYIEGEDEEDEDEEYGSSRMISDKEDQE